MKKAIFGFTVRDMTEIAMLCAVAVLLDVFVKIQIGATGGSLNIAMLPLFVIALRHGWFKGLVSGGIVFGLITCLIDDYGIATYPLEYFVSFGAVAVLGVFGRSVNRSLIRGDAKKISLAYAITIACVAVAAVIRFFAASIDSVILWDYEWGAAFAYNAPYVFFSAIAVGVLLCLMLPTVKMLDNLYPTAYLKEEE